MMQIRSPLSKLLKYFWRHKKAGLLLASCALYFSIISIERLLLPVTWPAPVGMEYQLYPASIVISDCNNIILRVTSNAHGERCLPVPLNQISPHVVNALIAAEDQDYYRHTGCDFFALARAAIINCWRGKRISGASTISMQWVRIIEQRPRTYQSKCLEIIRARQWERRWSKQQILNAYLNYAPWGGTLRGIEAASQYWYGKKSGELTLNEAATLIAMLPAPSRRKPNDDALIPYRTRILDRMLQLQFINSEQLESVNMGKEQLPTHARKHSWPFRAAHACDLALQHLQSPIVHRIDYQENHYPRLELSIDVQQQECIERIIHSHSANTQETINGLAVVVYDHNGARSLIGSPSFQKSQWNSASHAHDAGSTLKPFLYSLALRQGVIHSHSRVHDSEQSFNGYKVQNFDRDFKGSMRLAESLSQSRNLPAVKLLRRVGTDAFTQELKEQGLMNRNSQQTLHLDSALGSNAVSPLQLAQAYYQTFCLNPNDPSNRQVLQFLSLRCPDDQQLSYSNKTLYWKTGTSSGRRDAWSIIWSEQRVIVVWMGNLNASSNANTFGSGVCTEFASTLASALL